MKNARFTMFAAALALSVSACGEGQPDDPYQAAEAAYEANDYRAARLYLSGLLEEQPKNDEARLLFVRTLLAMNDPIAAETALAPLAGGKYADELPALRAHAKLLAGSGEEALNIASEAPAGPLAAWVKIGALGVLGRNEEAFAAGEEAAKAYPGDARILAAMGSLSLSNRQVSQAQNYSAAALKADAGNLDALMLAGQLSLLREDLQSAKKHFAQARSKHTGAMGPLFSLAATEADLGNLDEAEALIEEIREYSPDHPKGLFLDAKLAFVKGDLDGAYRKTLENERQLADMTGGLLLMGEIAHLRGNHNQAVARLREFLKRSPGHVHASTVLSQSLMALGDQAGAGSAIFPVANKASASPELLQLASKLARAGGGDDPYSARLSGGDPAKLAAGLAKADNAMAKRDWAAAAAEYQALRSSGWQSNAIVMNNSAMVALEQGKTAEAVKFARAAHKLVPLDPEVMDTLGWALLRNGSNAAEALALLTKAKDGLPGNVGIRWHYADALASNGRKAEARRIIMDIRRFANEEQKARIDGLLAQL